MSRNALLEAGAKSEGEVTATGPEPRTTQFLNKLSESTLYPHSDSIYISQNELGKICFQHNIIYEDFKDLNGRKAAEEVLCDKAFNIAKNRTYDRNVKLLLWFINFYIKKISGGTSKNENVFNEELTGDLRKQIIRKFDKRKV